MTEQGNEPGKQAMGAIIRKIVTVVEETQMEMGQKVSPPTRRAAAVAVIENPFAGKYVEDLSRPQGCGVRPQPFRWDGSTDQ
jgi:hypothetical protein